MYQHDLEPPLRCTLTNDGNPVDTTTATSVRLIGRRIGEDTPLIDQQINGTDDGSMRYDWQVGDTAQPGIIRIEVEIMWPGNRPQTIRADRSVLITADLG